MAIIDTQTNIDPSQQQPQQQPQPQADQQQQQVASAQQDQGTSLDDAMKQVSLDDAMSSVESAGQQQPSTSSSPDGMAEDQDAAATNAAAGDANPDLWQQQAQNPLGQDIVIGAAKAGFDLLDLKDIFTGEPKMQDRWAVRQFIENKAAGLVKENALNGIAQGITQFGIGFMGLGKIGWVKDGLALASKQGRLVHWGAEAARGIATASTFMDPHAERLSNLVESYPALQNPVTNFLASKQDDSAALGRLKNGIEGVVMDGVLTSAIGLVAKGIKLARAGDVAAANEAAAQADALFTKAAKPENQAEHLTPTPEETTIPEGQGGETNAEVHSGGDSGVSASQHGQEGVDSSLGVAATGDNGGPVAEGVAGQQPGGDSSAADRGVQGDSVSSDAGPSRSDAERSGGLDLQVSDEQVTAGLKQLAADNKALLTYGTRADAIAAGYEFKPSTTGVIPWQKLNTTENTQAWMDALIHDQSSYINARRGGDADGVLSDESVQAMVQQRAATWNESPADLMGVLKASGDDAAEMAANMETSFLIANKAYQDAYDLATRISNDNFTGFGSRQEALAALQHRMGMATVMYANGKAIVSNAARSMRRMRSDFRFTDEQLSNITTADPEQLLKLVNDTGGNPQLLAKAGRISLLQRIVDPIAGMQAANLLWGWKTQVVNFATSAAMLVWRPLETSLGSLVQTAYGAARGDAGMVAAANSIRQQSMREVTYLASMLSDGWNAAKDAFIEGDSILTPKAQEHFNVSPMQAANLAELAQSWRVMNTMDDVVANAMTAASFGKAALTGSLRIMGASDEMIKTMRYRAIVAAKASVDADQQGLVAGSAAYKDYVSSQLDASTDDLGRGLVPAALTEAQASTFQQNYVAPDQTWLKRRSLAQSVASIAADQVWPRLIAPFIKTPANLLRYGIKLTPALNLLQKEYVTALTGGAGVEAQARAMGQMTLGIMLSASGYALWSTERITGTGPQNPEQAKEWRKQGNRADALTWTNGDGERQYLDLNPYDPITQPMLLLADIAALHSGGHLRDDEVHGLAMSIVLALSNRLKDKTYLKSVGDFIAAMGDDNKVESMAERTAPGLLPFSSLMSSVNPDPALHEIRSTLDALMAKVPGWSPTLPPQRDLFGDVVLAPQGLTVPQRNSGPLADALGESFQVTGRYFDPPAPRSEQTGGVDLRDFSLKDGRSAYDRYQELAGHPPGAKPLKDMLTDVVTSKAYESLPHGASADRGTKEYLILNVMKAYRKAAWGLVQAESPELRQAVNQHKLDLAKAVATGAKSVPAVAGQARMGVINQLLAPMGLGLPRVNLPSQPPTSPPAGSPLSATSLGI